MSGHNKWSQIKNQKGAADKKRGLLFSKLLKAIAIAAKADPNPQFNPRLRSAIDQAKKANVPQDNIDRAVSKASEEKPLEDVVVEAYGPEGVALIIEGITDNTNRTIAEVKHLLSEHNAKIATPGSVLWSFEKKDGVWQAKFPQAISDTAKAQIAELVEALNDHDDVQLVTTNAAA
ncbi:YebC/PmpR family DNA-binding transcriptional regulator [Patescibacteria group bacterium]|nr:YebC/PmpR family DNA-binding transcriptional regulator [Patescibacteria group bacterium]